MKKKPKPKRSVPRLPSLSHQIDDLRARIEDLEKRLFQAEHPIGFIPKGTEINSEEL